MEWWETTKWHRAKEAEGKNPIQLINFDQRARHAPAWRSFVQGATCTDGRPVVTCLLCSTVLGHSSASSSGPSSMAKHLKSSVCAKSQKKAKLQGRTC